MKPLNRGRGDRLCNGGFVSQAIVDRLGGTVRTRPQPHGGVSLRVQINQKDILSQAGETRGEIYGGGSLAYPALLVNDRDYTTHHSTPFTA